MSYDIVPDSAPFSSEQRAWLNGFLAGIMGTLDGNSATMGTPSSMHNSTALALSAGAAALALLPGQEPSGALETSGGSENREHNDDDEDFAWHEPTLTSDERMELAAGRPVELRMMAAMAQLDCGSCGYVCKTYARALASGQEKNLTLCSPGGSDTAKLLRQLSREAKSSANEPTKPVQPAGKTGSALARLKSNTRLNGAGSAKDTRHIAIDLSGTALQYSVGDALGVMPKNCPELIERVCNAASCFTDADVLADEAQSIRLRELLSGRCLRTIPAELIARALQRVQERPKTNGSVAADAKLVDRLERFLDEDDFSDLDVLEFLDRFAPLGLAAQDLADTLIPLRSRLYSIASSHAAHPNEVHLTVGRVEDQVRGRARKGVASSMLADRVEAGAIVEVFIQPHHGFTIPSNPATDMVMIGPGTGIAPFIAFLQQREVDKATGRNWLFFGDQTREHDFLYRQQLENWQTSGHLTRLDLAFSRESEVKIYVQHRMREHGAELVRWLESGSALYVCGDAKRMARDVEATLLEIISQHGNQSTSSAKETIRAMKQSHQYVCDVY